MEEKIEDIKRESKGPKASGLDEEQADLLSKLDGGYRPHQDCRNGGIRGRRISDIDTATQVSLLNRMQESGEVQRSVRHTDTGQYTFDYGTPWSDKDEPS
jgi:hypothetical protein